MTRAVPELRRDDVVIVRLVQPGAVQSIHLEPGATLRVRAGGDAWFCARYGGRLVFAPTPEGWKVEITSEVCPPPALTLRREAIAKVTIRVALPAHAVLDELDVAGGRRAYRRPRRVPLEAERRAWRAIAEALSRAPAEDVASLVDEIRRDLELARARAARGAVTRRRKTSPPPLAAERDAWRSIVAAINRAPITEAERLVADIREDLACWPDARRWTP